MEIERLKKVFEE